MKTKLLTLLAWSIASFAIGQSNVIQNGGFEDWTQQSITENLDNWETTENEFPGTGAVVKSSDAVDGNFSLHLSTITIEDDTAFGFALLGGFGDNGPERHILYSSPVDSLTGWYKYETMGTDSAIILLSRKSAIVGVPEMNIWKLAGTQGTWKRFSYPLTSGTQDSILFAFASSNALADEITPGSFLMLDNLQFKNSLGASPAPIPNHSFENWSPVTIEFPNSWYTYAEIFSATDDVTVKKTTDAASGSFALSLETISIDGDEIPGILSTGEIPPNSFPRATPYTAQPTTFTLDYKFVPSNLDTAFYGLIFYNDDTVMSAEFNFFVPNPSTYLNYSVPISVPTAPDSMVLYFSSGANYGSKLWLDNVALTGGNVGLNSWSVKNEIAAYPNPSNGFSTVLINSSVNEKAEYSILDMTGRILIRETLQMATGSTKLSLNLSSFEAGNYLFVLKSSSGTITEQLIISK